MSVGFRLISRAKRLYLGYVARDRAQLERLLDLRFAEIVRAISAARLKPPPRYARRSTQPAERPAGAEHGW